MCKPPEGRLRQSDYSPPIDDYDWEADAIGSFRDAIAEIGRRVKAGEEPVPTTGYFGSAKG